MANTISNQDDVIDGRDIIARIDELEELEEAVADAEEAVQDHAAELQPSGDGPDPLYQALEDAQEAFGKDEQKELKTLREIVDEAGSELRHGESLIRDSHFETYARELAEETSDMSSKQASQWPFTCIDCEKAADELKQDYTSVDFDGETYWTRA